MYACKALLLTSICVSVQNFRTNVHHSSRICNCMQCTCSRLLTNRKSVTVNLCRWRIRFNGIFTSGNRARLTGNPHSGTRRASNTPKPSLTMFALPFSAAPQLPPYSIVYVEEGCGSLRALIVCQRNLRDLCVLSVDSWETPHQWLESGRHDLGWSLHRPGSLQRTANYAIVGSCNEKSMRPVGRQVLALKNESCWPWAHSRR